MSMILRPLLLLYKGLYDVSVRTPLLEQQEWRGPHGEDWGSASVFGQSLLWDPLSSRKTITGEEDRKIALFVWGIKAMSSLSLS